MNVIDFGDRACGQIQPLLDSYIDNELLVETNLKVLRHLEHCAKCQEVLESRIALKKGLRRAAGSVTAPPELMIAVQSQMRSARSAIWTRWALATAAALVILVGWQLSTSAGVRRILGIGVADHLHCAIEGGTGKQTQSLNEILGPSGSLGPEYATLLHNIQAQVGVNLPIVVGHICHVNNRDYVHIILRNQTQLVSVIVTKELQDHFPIADLRTIHGAAVENFQAAGFESSGHLVFVVSDSNLEANLKMAGELAPAMNEFLSHAKN